eukprot:360647-Chlamydomonas_euryale.AAC.1
MSDTTLLRTTSQDLTLALAPALREIPRCPEVSMDMSMDISSHDLDMAIWTPLDMSIDTCPHTPGGHPLDML